MDVEMVEDENLVENEEEDDESSKDDEEEVLEAKVKELEERITANSFDYNAHTELIEHLKKLAELERLRCARNRMSTHFPLTPELWLDWLKDEIKLATTLEEKKKIVELFETAVKDYQSVELWLEYCQFNIGIQDHDLKECMSKIREIFERAITAVGLHVLKGGILWEAYLEFEIYVLGALTADKEQEPGKTAYVTQVKRIGNLFKRQLSCSLFDMEDSRKRFDEWFEEIADSDAADTATIKHVYSNALKNLETLKQFESDLMSDEKSKLEVYKQYLEHEKSKQGVPARAVCLYERAISDGTFCLESSLWLEYMEYLNETLSQETVLDVCRRGLRNIPWCVSVHQYYILCLEKFNQPNIDVTGAMEQAFTSGFQQPTDYRDIWLTYLEYLRRRYDSLDIEKAEEEKRLSELREGFQRALDHLANFDNADPECSIAQFWARIEASFCKNMEKSREIWDQLMLIENNNTANMWLEYIHLEKTYGNSKHLRRLFTRALQYTRDWPELIQKAYLNYERDEGTFESYLACLRKCKARLKEINEIRNREVSPKKVEVQITRKTGKRAGLGYATTTTQETRKPLVGYKRKTETKQQEEDISPTKKVRFEDEKDEPKVKENLSTKDLVDNLLKEENKDTQHGTTVTHDSSKDHLTVFVSNLSFDVEESTIRDVFSSVGEITDLRLVKDFKGRSKGFCYIVLQSQKQVTEALKKDREKLDGRPMYVSKCDPDKATRSSGFKFSTSLEKNKLFIRGLPVSTTEEDLRKLFEEYGAVKDVRLVTYRNGHSKGLAYVDYEDEVSAAAAIVKADGMKLGDFTISVAMSHPPTRKVEEPKPQIASLGGGPKEHGPRGRSRTQMSFLPRTVQLQQNNPTTSMANLSLASPTPTAENGKSDKKALSNSQFRDMLLSKSRE